MEYEMEVKSAIQETFEGLVRMSATNIAFQTITLKEIAKISGSDPTELMREVSVMTEHQMDYLINRLYEIYGKVNIDQIFKKE